MILKGISVNQNPPTKDYLWITPKGNTRFWDQSTWRLIGGNGGGGGDLPTPTAAGKYLKSIENDGDYYATWGDLNLNGYINGDTGYAAVFSGSNSIVSAKLTNSKIRIGNGIIEWDDTNGGFKIYNATSTQATPITAGIYADWVSALGPNPNGGGGGGGIDIVELWKELTDNSSWESGDTKVINWSHLPSIDAQHLPMADILPTITPSTTPWPTYYIDIKGNADTATTATKLSTVSKTAWGQTFWTSGGVPQSIDGNMSSVGNIICSGNKTKNIGESNHIWNTLYVDKIQIGNAIISFDDNTNVKMLKVSGVTGTTFNGLYSTEAVSALGSNSSGGGGGSGLDVETLWEYLQSNDGGLTGQTPKIYATLLGSSLDTNKILKYTGNNYAIWSTLLASDIPTLSITDKTSGILPVNRGGTGATTFTSGYLLTGNGASAVQAYQPAWQSWVGGTTAGPKAKIKLGNVDYTSDAIPSASNTASGIVTTGNQTFAGRKTMSLVNPHIYDGNSNSSRYKRLYFNNGSDTLVGQLTYDSGNATNVTSGQFTFDEYSPNSTASTTTTGYYERYKLPVVNSGLSANTTYDILTTKDLSFSITGNAATATTASKLGTSTVGNSITPFYLNAGTATVCSLYRYHYDGNSDYASYAWHKVAYAEAAANSDKVITFLVSSGHTSSINGVLRCRGRWNSDGASTPSPVYTTAGATWVINNGISVNDFVLVWKSPNLELWCKIPARYGGYHFTVLDSGGRTNGGSLTWILSANLSGHGSASYTSGGTVIASSVATLTNNLSGTVNGYSISSSVNSGTSNRLAYYTSSGIDDASTTYVSNTKLAINSTSEPSYNFYVDGTSCFIDNLYINNTKGIRIGNNATPSVYQDVMRLDSSNAFIIGNGTSASGYTTYLDGNIVNIRYGTSHTSGIYLNASGNVGINTTSPGYKLDVRSSAYNSLNVQRNDSANGSCIRFSNNSGQLGRFGCSTENSGYFRWDGSDTTALMYLISNASDSKFGNLGIGTNAPPVKLSVAGDIYASGGVTALQTVTSDKRFKKNIKKFEAKEIIDKLQPVEFEWNSKAKKYSDTFKDGKNYGLIAQDSDNIIDDLVFDLPGSKGYKGVRYEKLIPILLQAIKEQTEKIENLEYEINVLKGVYK